MELFFPVIVFFPKKKKLFGMTYYVVPPMV
jgi:hypothetical protein